MKSFKTAVKIFKKELEFKFITYNIVAEDRTSLRRHRQASIRELKTRMIDDLFNRNSVGDIRIWQEDLDELHRMRATPIFSNIEKIYKKYT